MISIENLHYTYPESAVALRGVTLTVENGEAIAIVGENGAGKTTLVKHLNGLLKPQEGRVVVNGVETSRVSVAQLARHVGFIFQNPDYQLFGETVEEEVAFALKNFDYDAETIKRRVDSALKLLDLERYRGRSPLALSDGERKRVALASVLCYEPEIIIFDEPTLGQDYAQKSKIAGFINQLKLQGKTVICITHDMEFVAENFTRVVVLSRGKVVKDGDAREVLTDLELLKASGLLPVQMTELASRLARKGIPRDVLTVPEMLVAMRRLKAGS